MLQAEGHANPFITDPSDGGTVPDPRPTDDPWATDTPGFAPEFESVDLSIPKATILSWRPIEPTIGLRYDVFLSERRDEWPASALVASTPHLSAPVWNLKTGAQYFWKIVARKKRRVYAESGVLSFRTPAVWPRWIRIEGATNARDFGGVANREGRMTRQGLLYRSSEFDAHCPITPEGRRAVAELGIRTDLDLRKAGEKVFPENEVQYLRIGVTANLDGLAKEQETYRDVFLALAEKANYPIVLHCWGGADRTGTVAVLVTAALGWSDDAIVRDYQWTSLSVWGPRGREGACGFEEFREAIAFLRSHDKANGSLQQGSCNYLLSIGVPAEKIEAVREILLEGKGRSAQVSGVGIQDSAAASAPFPAS